jgi:hypothetical protein
MVRTDQAVKFNFSQVVYLATLTQNMHHRSIFNDKPVKVVHLFKHAYNSLFGKLQRSVLYSTDFRGILP